MKLAKVIAVSVLSGASIALAATQVVTFQGSSSLTAKVTGEHGEGLDIEKIETRFFDQRLYTVGADPYERLFKVVERSNTNTLTDGETQLSYIEAYQTKKSPLDTKIWTLKSRGGGFEILNDDFVQVSEQGCCDSPTLNHVINSESGKQVVEAMNGSLMRFAVPNSNLPSRYLALVNDTKAPRKRGNRGYVASIAYFTNSKVKSIVRIYASLDQGAASDLYTVDTVKNAKDETQGTTVNLWSANGSNDPKVAFSGFGFSGSVFVGQGGEQSFTVIIDHDEFSQQLSKISPKLDLEVIKLN